ncbi:uncharacterized protein BJX67DRAFT_132414 [Aspergillus lucknowensis]|uniref:Uncharacterized protein n=1 Tax=Aspergillus lucknowensis TaxID=176173 RepID=A0ABR4LPW9_9EURO
MGELIIAPSAGPKIWDIECLERVSGVCPCLRCRPRFSSLFIPNMSTPDNDPPSSRSCSSSESAIYNALKASSDDARATPDPSEALEQVGSRQAANIAMFCSLSSESAPCRPRRNTNDQLERPPKALLADKLRTAFTWSLPDSFLPAVEAGKQSPVLHSTASGSEDDLRFPNLSSVRWPRNIKSPADPASPHYPPPVRQPTPPGVPSFGSEAAMSYDFRFGARPQAPAPGESLLRRLFQRASNPSGPQEAPRRPTRLFAEDGTAVLGSFPQRQSGHGTNLSRGLSGHPFHLGDLSISQRDGFGAGRNDLPCSDTPSGGPSSSDYYQSPPWSGSPLAASPDVGFQERLGLPANQLNSFHTSISQIQGRANRSAPPALTNAVEPSRSLESTEATRPSTSNTREVFADTTSRESSLAIWGDIVKRVRSVFFHCCSRSGDEPVPSQSSTTTQDTFVTACDRVS